MTITTVIVKCQVFAKLAKAYTLLQELRKKNPYYTKYKRANAIKKKPSKELGEFREEGFLAVDI